MAEHVGVSGESSSIVSHCELLLVEELVNTVQRGLDLVCHQLLLLSGPRRSACTIVNALTARSRRLVTIMSLALALMTLREVGKLLCISTVSGSSLAKNTTWAGGVCDCKLAWV